MSMPEVSVSLQVPWGYGASVSGTLRFPWGYGTTVYSLGGPYTPATPPVGADPLDPTPPVPGAVIPAQAVYVQAHSMQLIDERDESLLDSQSLTISTDEDSVFWALQAEGGPSLYAALIAGEQPVVVRAEINGLSWRFVIDTVTRSRQFGAERASARGRSTTLLAGSPYQRAENWAIDGDTTAAQIVATALSNTGVAVDWQVLDWNVPNRVFSVTGTPLDVARAVAAGVGAVVQSDRLLPTLTVMPRFPVLPNEWPASIPGVEIGFDAVVDESYERIDQADYNGVYLSGQQQGVLGFVRRAGTNGAKLHPLVTDLLLTDAPALSQRGAAILGASDVPARSRLQLPVLTAEGQAGVLTVGQMVRVTDPAGRWWGQVQGVSVAASLGSARQTVSFKRLVVPPAAPVAEPLVFDGPIPDQTVTLGDTLALDLAAYWTGGQNPRIYSKRAGEFPSGVALDQALQRLAGEPTSVGVTTGIRLRAVDDTGQQADSNAFSVTVEAAGASWANTFLRMPLNSGAPYDVSLNQFAFADVDSFDSGAPGSYANGGIKAGAAAFGAAGWRAAEDEFGQSRVLFWSSEFLTGAKEIAFDAGTLYVWGTQDWSIECTIRPGSIGNAESSQRRVSLQFDNPDVARLDLITFGSRVQCLVRMPELTPLTAATIGTILDQEGVFRLQSAPGVLTAGVRAHIAAQRIGNILQVLCNGVVVAQCTISADFDQLFSIVVGGATDDFLGSFFSIASAPWPSYDDIDEVRILLGETTYVAPYDVPNAQLPIAP
jgi:hypothetical protein